MTEFEASERESGGLREVRFRLGEAPGLLWLPDGEEGPFPLVLIQHPGMSRKEDPIVSGPARAWATTHGWACLGLDAPGHGERAVADLFAAMRDPEQAAAMAAQFAGEVAAVIDALAERYPVDTGRLGYYGYSLGAMLVDEDGGGRVASQVGDLLAAAGGVDLASRPAEPEGGEVDAVAGSGGGDAHVPGGGHDLVNLFGGEGELLGNGHGQPPVEVRAMIGCGRRGRAWFNGRMRPSQG